MRRRRGKDLTLEELRKMILIKAKYTGYCIKCGHAIYRGDQAYWARGVGVLCLDCYEGEMESR